MRPLICLALALGLTACVQDGSTVPPSAAAAGQRAQVYFADLRTPADPAGTLAIRFDDGSGPRVVQPPDLRPRLWAFPSSETYETQRSGTLRVNVTFRGNGKAGDGAVELPLRSDWRWGVHIHVTSRNPLEGCMGCMGHRSFPLSGGGPSEMLHIVWGGQSISAPTPS